MGKRFFSTIIIAFLSSPAFAQLNKACIYLNFGGGRGFGTTTMYNAGLNFKYKRWVASANLMYVEKDAYNVPDNYEAGLVIFGPSAPQQYLQGLTLESGPVFYIFRNKARFLAKGGIFIGNYSFPDNFRPVYSGWFGSNYNFDEETIGVVGLVIHPELELPLARWIGISVGAKAVLNESESMFSMDFNLLLGKVKNKQK